MYYQVAKQFDSSDIALYCFCSVHLIMLLSLKGNKVFGPGLQ